MSTEASPATSHPGHPGALADQFKLTFRRHPAGVAVVAAATAAGPRGLTVSSLASVAAEPCAISFSVSSSRGSAGAILDAEHFAVSVLSAEHIAVAQSFSIPGAPRFGDDQNWVEFDDGQPFVATAPAAMRCRPIAVVPVGSSSLVLAEVLEMRIGHPGRPLVYHDRDFHTLS